MEESKRVIVTMAATSSPASTWSITGGIDAAFFEIDEDTGEVTMPGSANYENPEDDDANNVYEVEVNATNSEGNDSRLVCVAFRDEW